MAAPYRNEHALAWIESDPEGVRVHRASIITIEPAPEPDHWLITTDRGTTIVDHAGISSNAVPLDPEIADDLYVYGDGYLVTSTLIELDLGANAESSLDQGDDLGLD
jgi:hypothetical protein